MGRVAIFFFWRVTITWPSASQILRWARTETGWDLMTWDVGFNQIVGGQRRKIQVGDGDASERIAGHVANLLCRTTVLDSC